MKINKNERQFFGTDGIRGKVGSRLINAEFMMKLGWAVGLVLMESRNPADKRLTVLMGHDTRQSADMLESALQCGLTTAGVDVKLLGTLPTPAIAYLTHSLRAAAGIVISASHNAYPDNGIKFFNHQGMKLSDVTELAIEAALEKPMRAVNADGLGKTIPLTDASIRYVEFCKATFPSQLDLTRLKLVLDCANGATFSVAPKVFSELGAETICIHCTPDGKNINHQCGATNVESLQVAVNRYKADLGLAFDGDGDRLIMVDHKGEVVDGDEILCVLAKDRVTGLASRAGVVGTIMSNLGLEQTLLADGIAFERTPVGDRYVLEALMQNGWVLGGEASGHIVDLDYTTTGDGIITALQVLRIICMAKKTLHELKQSMVKRPQVLINVPIQEDKNIDLESNVMIKEAMLKANNDLKNEGRILLRPSGTESLIRVMVEGHDGRIVRNIAQSLAETVAYCCKQEAS